MDKFKHALSLSVMKSVGKNAMGQVFSCVCKC